jgi:hypothetical protein
MFIFTAVGFSAASGGQMPGTDEISAALTKAVIDVFNAQSPKLWGLIGIDTPDPAVQHWRVAVSSAAVRSGPDSTFAVVMYVKQGDVVAGTEINGGWLHVGAGWLKTNQVEAISE